ncbi:hypothetical protein JCM10212_003614 [Sporobolomyces blumeae]
MRLVALAVAFGSLVQHANAWLGRGSAVASSASDSDQTAVGRGQAVQDVLESLGAARREQSDAPALSPSNPSCFFRALSSLPTSSPCETLAHSDALRSEVAVSMALCEIATAEGLRVPRECVDWQKGMKGKPGPCVEALSRSPQYWSSYSGYLREIVSLCSAFRRWADVEIARDLNAASASAFADFASAVRAYEDVRQTRQRKEDTAWDKTSLHLASLVFELSQLSAEQASSHRARLQEIGRANTELASAISDLASVPGRLEAALSKLAEQYDDDLRHRTQVFDVELHTVAKQHATALQAASNDLRSELSTSVAALSRSIEVLESRIGSSTSSVQETQLSIDSTAQLQPLRAGIVEVSALLAERLEHGLQKQLSLEKRLDRNLEQAEQLHDVLLNLTEMAQTSWTSTQGYSFNLDAVVDALGWIRFFVGLFVDALGLSNLVLGVLAFALTGYYPLVTYLAVRSASPSLPLDDTIKLIGICRESARYS